MKLEFLQSKKSPAKEFGGLLKQLDSLIEKGEGDGTEADELRERMMNCYPDLSESEIKDFESIAVPENRKQTSTAESKKVLTEHFGKDILSSDVEIKGTIKFQKELLIDGKVEGEINSDGALIVGENANIHADIKTKSITIYGKVQGNVSVNGRCELKSKCTLQGDLKAARLIIEEGSTFIGRSEVSSGMSVKRATDRSEAGTYQEATERSLVRA